MITERVNPVEPVRKRWRSIKYPLAFLMLLLFIGEGFLAGQYYIRSKGDWLRIFGARSEGPYATKAEAESAQKKMARGGVSLEDVLRNTEIIGSPTGRDADQSSSSGRYTGNDLRLIVGQSLIDFIFARPDTSAQDALAKQKQKEEDALAKQKQKEEEEKIEAERREEEARFAKATEEWNQLQRTEAEERALEKKKKEERAAGLLEKIGAVGGEASTSNLTIKTLATDFFGTGHPADVPLQAAGTAKYPTSGFTALQSLQASADFFQSALAVTDGENPDYEKAAFFGQQADKVIQKQPTNVPSKFAALPNVPAPTHAEEIKALNQKMAVLNRSFNNKLVTIQTVEVKIAELDVQVKAAEHNKEMAQFKLKEAEAKAVAAKPEEKPQVDDLKHQAELALQEAKDQEANAIQEKAASLKDEDKLKDDLKDLKDKLKEIDNKLKSFGK